MARNFYYGKDADIVSGSATFAKRLMQDPLSLPPDRVQAYAAEDEALQTAYRKATTPITRTTVAVSEKNLTLRNVQRSAARLASALYASPEVSDAQLTTLGLQPRRGRTKRVLDGTPPAIQVIAVVGRWVKIRIYDIDNATRRAKPTAAWAAQLYWFAGPEAPTDPRQYHFQTTTTRTITDIVFPNAIASGATIWLSARWVSLRGQTSHGSAPISFALQGGAVLAA